MFQDSQQNVTDKLEELNGVIDRIIFTNPENGFSVLKLQGSTYKNYNVVGAFSPSILQIGKTLSCKGKWATHPKYGKQFEVLSYQMTIQKNRQSIQKYLAGNIPGIGPIYAQKIVETFDVEALEIMDKHPERLIEISGIGKNKLSRIQEHWKTHKNSQEILFFLREYGIGPTSAKKIYQKYGTKSVEAIQKNPYLLIQEIRGIGFKIADEIAQKLGFEEEHPLRIEAGIEYILQMTADNGHTCFPEQDFVPLVTNCLNILPLKIQNILHTLEKEGRILRKSLEFEQSSIPHKDTRTFIWKSSLFSTEIGIVKHLQRLQLHHWPKKIFSYDKLVEWAKKQLCIQFSTEQINAIKDCLRNKVHIITGGPGTGKSTITKALVSIYEQMSSKIFLCAPTGKASKRLSEITKKKASTIHLLLEFDPLARQFKRNLTHPLNCDCIIIDESSMIDTYLFFSLIKAIPSHASVLCIGDVDQLPSIGPGSILRDLLASSTISKSYLSHIFRQKQNSTITLNAHKINNGIFPYLTADASTDCQFYEINEAEKISQKIPQIIENIISSHQFHPLKDIQVLSPMRKGIIGVNNINEILQRHLNHHPTHIKHMGQILKIGDKVIQTKNNYTKLIFNGDIGYVTNVQSDPLILTVSFDGRTLSYNSAELFELSLAYAISVHKYQGSESPCIIIPIHISHLPILKRNLLYTAITRAKKLLIIIGSKQAIAITIKTHKKNERYTGLASLLLSKTNVAHQRGNFLN